MLIYKIKRRKFFNFSLGGNETHQNIKVESASSSVLCVCVKKMCFIFIYNLTQCVIKKSQPKKAMHKTINFVSTN